MNEQVQKRVTGCTIKIKKNKKTNKQNTKQNEAKKNKTKKNKQIQ